MNRIMNSDVATTRLIYALSAIVILGGFKSSTYILEKLTELPVQSAPRVTNNKSSIDTSTFYPVWVKQASAKIISNSNSNIDTFFHKPPVVQEVVVAPTPKAQEPNYIEELSRKIRINGVANDGAFINGRFFKNGELLKDLTYQTVGGTKITPILEKVDSKYVIIKAAGTRLKKSYKKNS